MTTTQPAFTRASPDARRQSLIEATARVLSCKGAAGVSVRAICAEAGVSPGLLRHYFAGVSEVIAETYRWIGELRPDLAGARLPAVALTALIDGLWLELSLGHAPFTPDEAARLAEMWLDRLLG